MRRIASFTLIALLLAFSPTLWAQAPDFIPVQGYLTDADGNPLEGEHSLTLRLYESDTAAAPLYFETQQVLVEGGLFHLYLGSSAETTLDLQLFAEQGSLFLSLQVDSDPAMEPRLPLGSVPYAAYAERAGDAASLGGHPASDYLLATAGLDWGQLTEVPEAFSDGVDDDTLATLPCTAGQIPAFDGSAWGCVDPTVDTQLTEAQVDSFVANNNYADAGHNHDGEYAPLSHTHPWGEVTDKPAGFADGVDDDTTYQAGTGLTLDGTTFNATGVSLAHVLKVSPSGGDYATPAEAMAAITAAGDAAADNPYLVLIGPGKYMGEFTVPSFVHVRGMNRDACILSSTVNDAGWPATLATVMLSSDSGLSDLTILNEGTGTDYVLAVSITVGAVDVNLYNLTVESKTAVSGIPMGITNNGGEATVRNVRVEVANGESSVCLLGETDSNTSVRDSQCLAEGTDYSYGFMCNNPGCSMSLRDTNLTINGSTEAHGIINFLGDMAAHNCMVSVSSSDVAYGLWTTSIGHIQFLGGEILADGPNAISVLAEIGNVSVHQTKLSATGTSAIGASGINGGTVNLRFCDMDNITSGSVTCAATTYNGIFYNNVCP